VPECGVRKELALAELRRSCPLVPRFPGQHQIYLCPLHLNFAATKQANSFSLCWWKCLFCKCMPTYTNTEFSRTTNLSTSIWHWSKTRQSAQSTGPSYASLLSNYAQEAPSASEVRAHWIGLRTHCFHRNILVMVSRLTDGTTLKRHFCCLWRWSCFWAKNRRWQKTWSREKVSVTWLYVLGHTEIDSSVLELQTLVFLFARLLKLTAACYKSHVLVYWLLSRNDGAVYIFISTFLSNDIVNENWNWTMAILALV